MKQTGVIHFQIHGEFVTRLARDLWAEGSEEKALNLLVTGVHNMTEGLAIDICAGRLKLDGVNNNIKLKKDNAKTDSRGLPLPQSFAEVLKKKLKALKAEQEDKAQIIREVIERMDDGEWNKLKESGFTESSIPPIISRMTGMDLDENVKPDKSLKAQTGWLSPSGDLYPCRYWEHIALIGQLIDGGEADAEKLGWKKLQNSKWFCMPEPELTQRQRDTIFDWCQKHKKKMPEWTEFEQ